MQDPTAADFLEWQALCTKCRLNPSVRTHGWCRSCLTADAKRWRHENPEAARERNYNASIKRRFGITPEDFDTLVDAQHGLCALCGDLLRPELKAAIHIDHNAATGQIRGVLCRSCNIIIGHAGDDPERLRLIARALPAYITAKPVCPAQTKFPKA